MWQTIAENLRRLGIWVRGLNDVWRLVEFCRSWPFFTDHLVIALTDIFECANLLFSFIIQMNISVTTLM